MIHEGQLTDRRPGPLFLPCKVTKAFHHGGDHLRPNDRVLLPRLEAERRHREGYVEILGQGLSGFHQTVAL
jgi:hypothetical protein